MESAKTKINIIVFDACRNNPFEAGRSWVRGSEVRGLSVMSAPSGSIVIYATAPGTTASDGINGSNGLYTSALLKHIKTSGLTIEQMLKRVRKEVSEHSSGKQVPWNSSSLVGDFFFKR